MTAAEIEAIEARVKAEWSRDADGEFISETWSADFVGPTIMALVAEVRRLRAVVKSLEWGSCDGCGTRRHCTECEGNSDGRYDAERDEWVTTPFHEATCPVFTPDGQVR